MLLRFAALDARERHLVVSALGWVLVARTTLLIGGRSVVEQQRRLERLAARIRPLSGCSADDASWAITAAARRVPGTRCLAWSLALRGLLAQAGIGSELRIGVAASGPGTIEAHAWVVSGGRSWSWGGDVDGFNVLHSRAAAG